MSDVERVVGSIIIPAHNEGRVIARCLASVLAEVDELDIDVIVACNGCSDDTSRQARAFAPRVTVLDIERPSKTNALNVAEAQTSKFPRLYLDADVELSGATVLALFRYLLTHPSMHAVRPTVAWHSVGASRLVQAYYRGRAHLPAVHAEVWGAGSFALSAEARSLFGEFPDVVADDLFVSQRVGRERTAVLPDVTVRVRTPTDVRSLLRVMQRAYRGAHQLSTGSDDYVSTTGSSLIGLLRAAVRGPRDAADVAAYAFVTVLARLNRLRVRSNQPRWERDDSSR